MFIFGVNCNAVLLVYAAFRLCKCLAYICIYNYNAGRNLFSVKLNEDGCFDNFPKSMSDAFVFQKGLIASMGESTNYRENLKIFILT